MDRATFEKIVGGKTATVTTEENGIVEVWFDGNGEIAIAQGADVVELLEPSPFRLRCLLHGLGIKCDWDEPVTFERLMELEGAVAADDGVLFSSDENEYYFGELAEGWHNNKIGIVTTMRQVHLLLEAAGIQ